VHICTAMLANPVAAAAAVVTSLVKLRWHFHMQPTFASVATPAAADLCC
jgi:hypothetical protein